MNRISDVVKDAQGMRVKNPLLRLLIATGFFLAPVLIAAVIKMGMRSAGINDLLALRLVHLFVTIGLLVWSYSLYLKWIERRSLSELSLRHAPRDLGIGLLVGFVLISLSVLILWIAGVYKVEGVQIALRLFKWPVLFLVTVFIEELFFRGIMLRLLDEALGTIIAVLISGTLFGLLHWTNEGATLWSSLAVAVEGGIMVGFFWRLSGRLWGVLGLHYAWNTVQGPLFGFDVSGSPQMGFMQASLTGPTILTGGAFGLENTIITVTLTLIATLIFYRMARTRGAWTSPPWKRSV
ncbi:CPBP family intramembrane metalloprotease [bacterium]|nr:CPBP family intramembrane metalloprotease [bacterium]